MCTAMFTDVLSGAAPIRVAFLTQPATLPDVAAAIALVTGTAQAIAAANKPPNISRVLDLVITNFPLEFT